MIHVEVEFVKNFRGYKSFKKIALLYVVIFKNKHY